jgi:hypothetical protein
MSSRLILMKIGVPRDEQSAQIIHMLKGVWISCLLSEW